MHVAIVGAGIGGLATAAALLRQGFEVSVYEQADRLGEVGAGIQMTPNATKVLRALGLEDELARRGFKPDAIFGLDWKSGKEAFRTPLAGHCDRIYGADYYHVHRADLHDLLRGLVPPEHIHLAHRCARIEQDADGATIHFENGASATADLVIGAVLIPGAAAPKLVTRDMLACMKPGAVLVDVAIDQGGCFETSHATTHADPTYVVDGIVHYCVANMPGAVARTSTYALNNVTLPHALRIADLGWKAALKANPHLAAGLNVHQGHVTYEAVASDLGYEYRPVGTLLD